VAWTRILLPDGRSVQLPGLPATDGAGARGVADQVDRHARRTLATAGALSLLSAAVQLSQPQNGNVLAAPSAGQVAAGALGQQLNQVTVEMLRRDLTNQQTIRIRQGTQFNVFLNADLTFPGPYAAATSNEGVRATAAMRSATPR
jgi:type IV secretion system protein VirB10